MVISNPNQGTILAVAEVNIYFPICLYNGFILIDSLCHNQLINIKLNLAHKLMKLGPISINGGWGVFVSIVTSPRFQWRSCILCSILTIIVSSFFSLYWQSFELRLLITPLVSSDYP